MLKNAFKTVGAVSKAIKTKSIVDTVKAGAATGKLLSMAKKKKKDESKRGPKNPRNPKGAR